MYEITNDLSLGWGLIISKILTLIITLLIAVAYLTLAERKVLGFIQNRRGPNVVGYWGILQPIADGIKLFTKELIIPNHANLFIYIMSPILALTLAFVAWAVIPYGGEAALSDLGVGVLYILAVSSISVYSILMSGWASNSKYAFLGAIRAAAQMISYEVSIGLIIISVILCAGSLNLMEIGLAQVPLVYIYQGPDIGENVVWSINVLGWHVGFGMWYIIPLWPIGIMFFVSALAETNRLPFDLTEGESELVSGFNVEYSSMSFALFFLAEYANIILMCVFGVILFMGGGLIGVKASFLIFLFIWIRASFPRVRYDQLMSLLWKSYLPLSLAFVVLVSSVMWGMAGLPPA